MAEGVRDKMVQSAVVLLSQHGLGGASFGEVIGHSGAPRGSIYHHFPDGKDQMIGAAVDLAGERAVSVLQSLAGGTPEQVLEGFMAMWRSVLTRSRMTAGCAVLAVTVATDSDDLLQRAGAVFRAWRSALRDLLVQGGLPERDADGLAALAVAASEGAVAMSRAEQDLTLFDDVARRLVETAAAASA